MPHNPLSRAIVVGKLPFHGDFVARGANARERRQIDHWLASSMATARDQFGPRFEESFDAAKPWLFAWHDGQWTAGALIPSVDKTGRRFPLLVGRSDLGRGQVEAGAKLCEAVAGEAISMRWSADRLLQAIAAVDIADDNSDPIPGWWSEDFADAARLMDRLPPGIMSHILAPVIGASA